MGSSESRDDVDSIRERATDFRRRSLPETPTSFRAAEQLRSTFTLTSSRPASMADLEDLASYTELTESPEGPEVDAQPTCCSGWRDAINSAGEDELRALLSNVVSTLENGLLPAERQTYYNWPAGNRACTTGSGGVD